MSKSTSMLPTLAGGSGVAAHTLVDADLIKVVDSVTLNADRDRKMTLGELGEFLRPHAHVSRLATMLPQDVSQGVSVTLATLDLSGLPYGAWEVTGWVRLAPLVSLGPCVPREGTITVKLGAISIAAHIFEEDQKINVYGGGLPYRTTSYQPIPQTYMTTSPGNAVITAEINASVATAGSDTYRVSGGVLTARRVWLS